MLHMFYLIFVGLFLFFLFYIPHRNQISLQLSFSPCPLGLLCVYNLVCFFLVPYFFLGFPLSFTPHISFFYWFPWLMAGFLDSPSEIIPRNNNNENNRPKHLIWLLTWPCLSNPNLICPRLRCGMRWCLIDFGRISYSLLSLWFLQDFPGKSYSTHILISFLQLNRG